jgi:hypothetical protein
MSKQQRAIVTTAFDLAVTSHADADKLLRAESQVQLATLAC